MSGEDSGVVPQFDFEALLHSSTSVTLGEAIVTLELMFQRYNYTKDAVRDHLAWLKLVLPPGNILPGTPYLFYKALDFNQPKITNLYYCKSCKREYDQPPDKCADCSSKIDHMINLSFIDQLETIISRPGTLETIENEIKKPSSENILNDIRDGSVYKEVASQFACFNTLLSCLLLTFTWCTDGIKLFRSSNYSIWPFFLCINEFPFHYRRMRQNIIMTGIWFGDDKPDINLFVKKTKDEALKVRNGIHVKVPGRSLPVKLYGIIMCGLCDLPAKAMALLLTLYSGYWGCNTCLQKGLRYMGKMVFPWQMRTVYRTDEQNEAFAKRALQTGKRVKGVIGVSELSRVVYKSIKSTAIDPMHCIFEGHVKYLLFLWFSSKFSGRIFSLKDKIGIVDAYIAYLKAPSFVKRIPRTFEKFRELLKANECKNWLLYYSLPILEKVMLPEYFECHKLLVLGISKLYSPNITLETTREARVALRLYQRKFQGLYGKEFMVMNCHLLKHLPQNVLKFGPICIATCFWPEDLLGQYKRGIHGSKDPHKQLVKNITRHLSLTALKLRIMNKNSTLYEFCQRFGSKYEKLKERLLFDDTYMVGAYRKIMANSLPVEVLNSLRPQTTITTRFYAYYRLRIGKFLFSSEAYTRHVKTCSYCVSFESNGMKKFGLIQSFIRIYNCSCKTACECEMITYALIKRCDVYNYFVASTGKMIHNMFKQIEIATRVTLGDVKQLRSVCFYIKIPNSPDTFIAEPLNSMESE